MSFLVRHPPVAVHGLCYGRLDVPLVAHADDLVARWLDSVTTCDGRVWTSPADRCRGVARQLAERFRRPLTVDERLAELNFGEWEGRSWDELQRSDGARLNAWMAAPVESRPPGGESAAELELRIRELLPHFAPNDWVITHAGPIRALRVALGLADWAGALAKPVPFLTTLELGARAP